MNKKIPSKYLILLFFLVLICLVLPMLILTMPAKAETKAPASTSNAAPAPPAPSNADVNKSLQQTVTKKEVVAPALQYLREDYPAAFLSKDDYSIKLNSQRKYKLRCSKTISAVAIGDIENVKAEENNEADEEKMLYELAAPKDIIVKTRQETYTYMQIFTDSNRPTTVMMSINAKNEVPSLITFGDCTMFEDI